MDLLYRLIKLLLFTELKLPVQKSRGLFSGLTFQGLLWLEDIALKALWLCDCWRCYAHSIVPLLMLTHSRRQERVKDRGLSGEHCTAAQEICSWDHPQKPWRKFTMGVRSSARSVTFAIITYYCLLLGCCSKEKKQLDLKDAVFSLRGSESLHPHSLRGVEIRGCGGWQLLTWAGGEDTEGR